MKLRINRADVKEITGLKGYNFFNHQRRKRHILNLMTQVFPSRSTILDIGCASGDIALELSFLGFQLTGIDSEASRTMQAKNLAAKYNCIARFECKGLDALSPEQKYDGILLGEVLEHFTNPTEILIRLKNFLYSNGRIIITAPNMPNLRNRLKFGLLGIFPDNNPEHKFYFDFPRLQKVVKDAGYQMLYFRTRFTHLFAGSERAAQLEHFVTAWFSYVFSKSGDSLFAILSPAT